MGLLLNSELTHYVNVLIDREKLIALYSLLGLSIQSKTVLWGLLILAIIAARLFYVYALHPLAHFPGPALAPATDLFWQFMLHAGRLTWHNHDWHKKYGKVVRVAPNHLSFSDPAAIKDIYGFVKPGDTPYTKDPEFFTIGLDGQWSIINENCIAKHAETRKILAHGFSNQNIIENESFLQRKVNEFCERMGQMKMEDGKKGVDIVKWFGYITWNIIGEWSYGESFEKVLSEQTEHKYHWCDAIIGATYVNDVLRSVSYIPGLENLLTTIKPLHWRKTSYRHLDYSLHHTKERLKMKDTKRKDLVWYFLNPKTGVIPPPEEMASHFASFLMAGTITTATFLSGTTYYLMRNPEPLRRLREELYANFPTVDDINCKALLSLPYVNAVVNEGLRIYPPAGALHLPRLSPKEGSWIAGHWVPGNTRVSVHPWSVVRDSANFHRPDEFIPERWLNVHNGTNEWGDKLDASTPFYMGPRVCLGKNLATHEMRLLLAKMVYQYDFEFLNGDTLDWERDNKGFTIWWKPEMRVLFHKRPHHL